MPFDLSADLDETAIPRLLKEILRAELVRIVAESQDPLLDAEARLTELNLECDALLKDAQSKSFAACEYAILSACDRLDFARPSVVPFPLGRGVTVLLKSLKAVERDVIETFADPLILAEPLLARHGLTVTDGRIPDLLRISDALEAALPGKSSEMVRKLTTTARIVIEFEGDLPLDRLPDHIDGILTRISRLPKHHGRSHGMNPNNRVPKIKKKQEEIAEADAHDQAQYAALTARNDLSVGQKRAELAGRLTPRVTLTNLERHLDRLHDILRSAASRKNYQGPTKLKTYPQLALLMKDDFKERRRENPLYLRVTLPKLRLRWSNERLVRLLSSPVYRGCWSDKRRSKPGRMVFRDAIYWVPLILLTMGTRVKEVLHLTRRDLLRRDGVHCLRLCWSAEQEGKTPSAQRIVPIPQVLLDLGLVDWIRSIEGGPSALLFPEIVSANADSPEDIFTKRFHTVRRGLGILHQNEDLYALRKTLSSALWRGGVSISDRQMIIGHASDTTIGAHYTDADMKSLKELLDRADHAIVVTNNTAHRHPIIAGCNLVSGTMASVEVRLDDKGDLGAFRVVSDDTGAQVLAIALVRNELPKNPRWKNLQVVTEAQAAEMAADLCGEFHLSPPEEQTMQMAWEHLMALASDSSEAKLKSASE
ncbi:MAG: tyrosine-type recombinase/integrase [Heliomarina sp.]|uniref:tyrosine-type recombinase/integrase n=1 Tax=Heliomarina sp. TaxID=2917556 RepID=UPI004058CC65